MLTKIKLGRKWLGDFPTIIYSELSALSIIVSSSPKMSQTTAILKTSNLLQPPLEPALVRLIRWLGVKSSLLLSLSLYFLVHSFIFLSIQSLGIFSFPEQLCIKSHLPHHILQNPFTNGSALTTWLQGLPAPLPSGKRACPWWTPAQFCTLVHAVLWLSATSWASLSLLSPVPAHLWPLPLKQLLPRISISPISFCCLLWLQRDRKVSERLPGIVNSM